MNSESETVEERAQKYWEVYAQGISNPDFHSVSKHTMFEFAAKFASSLLQEKEQRIKELEARFNDGWLKKFR